VTGVITEENSVAKVDHYISFTNNYCALQRYC